jgi:lysophospholipase L1-like esterase
MTTSPPRRFARYVSLGDSSTEGIDDPDEQGAYRGWSRRLAQRLADEHGSIEYANFGVRGRTTRQVLDHQLAPALALRPDLATLFSGTNDVLAARFDVVAVSGDMEALQRGLIASGATVLTFTLPDLTPVMPIARWIAPRIRALNDALRGTVARTGTILVDFAECSIAADARIWSADRIHANAIGHTRIADALAHAIGLPGADESWRTPLPPLGPKPRRERLAEELRWTARYLIPWIGSALLGHAAGAPRDVPQRSLQRVERVSSARAPIPTG